MKIEAFKLFEALNSSCIKKREVYKNKILSIFILATKIKKIYEYIPFGPFIVIETFIAMVVPFSTIISVLLLIFSLGTIKI